VYVGMLVCAYVGLMNMCDVEREGLIYCTLYLVSVPLCGYHRHVTITYIKPTSML
jgi:hypothetical protein